MTTLRARSRSQAPEKVTRRDVGILFGGGVAIFVGLVAIGLLITRLLSDSAVYRFDNSVSHWFLARRTPSLNTQSHYATLMSETITAIVLTAVLVGLFRWWFGRWRESIVVLTSIMGELFIFLLVTNTVDRARPPVPRLDAAPPTSSFPSGHTAAAVALYGCIAVIVWRHLAQRVLAGVIVVLCCCVPVLVALSRIYRGMHYPTDVTFGAIGGGLWLTLVVIVLLPPGRFGESADRPSRSERSNG